MATTFTKAGMTYEDHHFKHAEGGYQRSPPSKLKAMYDYLPTETAASSSKKVPKKVEISGSSPEANYEEMKLQARCVGVYVAVPNREPKNGYPVYKHVEEDLALFASTHNGESCWVVAHFTTMDVKEKVGMRMMGAEPPFEVKAGTWQCFQGGEKWSDAPTVKAKATHHGYGMEAKGMVQNTETSVSPKRAGAKKAAITS